MRANKMFMRNGNNTAIYFYFLPCIIFLGWT